MRSRCALLVPLLVVACLAKQASAPASAVRLDESECDGSAEWRQCMRQLELRFLPQVHGVSRDSAELRIDIPDRPALVLRDSVDEHGVGYQYLYRAYEPHISSHVVEVQLYEGGYYRLIAARTGRQMTLDAAPVVSPDGRLLLTASADTEAGYDPNRVRVLRMQGDSVVTEWELEPQLWGPVEPQWLNDSTAQVVRQPAIAHPDSTKLRTPLTIRRRSGMWSADSLAAP